MSFVKCFWGLLSLQISKQDYGGKRLFIRSNKTNQS